MVDNRLEMDKTIIIIIIIIIIITYHNPKHPKQSTGHPRYNSGTDIRDIHYHIAASA